MALKRKNLCYKAVLSSGGVILLFEKFDEAADNDICLNYFEDMLYVEMGNNVFLMTDSMLEHLLISPVLHIAVGTTDRYETDRPIKTIDVNLNVLSQLQGALTVISRHLGGGAQESL